MTVHTCRICGAAGEAETFLVREMMFGLREAFRYFRCAACDCLQIAEIPTDLERFYPAGYYAHQPMPRPTGIRGALRRQRNRYAIRRQGLLGAVLHRLNPYPRGDAFLWLSGAGRSPEARVIDIGCGNGDFLRDLREQGYPRLLGVDPFIEHDREAGGVPIRKALLEEVDGPFDLVMLHHSLEHIPDQHATFAQVARLLSPSGECLVRVPVSSSFAWEHYRENWVQLDAPRHLYLHSEASLRLLGARHGLELVRVVHDSTELQFAGSEMYQRDIPLVTTRGPFTKRELRKFRRRAEKLNRQGRGDSAAFFFVRAVGVAGSTDPA